MVDLFKSDGGHILIIPSNKISLNSYNQLFRSVSVSSYNLLIDAEKRVTSINYNHPLLVNAFYSKVTNFQYPKVEASYSFSSNSNSVLSYEDGSAFLVGNSGSYVFSSALNEDNSNFKNSPLIVYYFIEGRFKPHHHFVEQGKPANLCTL